MPSQENPDKRTLSMLIAFDLIGRNLKVEVEKVQVNNWEFIVAQD
jgi:hypothetical protein